MTYRTSSLLFFYHCFLCNRGNQSLDGAGLGTDKPAGPNKEDDEFDAYRKRMMLAYRFRPNPLVSTHINILLIRCYSVHFHLQFQFL